MTPAALIEVIEKAVKEYRYWNQGNQDHIESVAVSLVIEFADRLIEQLNEGWNEGTCSRGCSCKD